MRKKTSAVPPMMVMNRLRIDFRTSLMKMTSAGGDCIVPVRPIHLLLISARPELPHPFRVPGENIRCTGEKQFDRGCTRQQAVLNNALERAAPCFRIISRRIDTPYACLRE